jgi:trimeric autotransporter adhesin
MKNRQRTLLRTTTAMAMMASVFGLVLTPDTAQAACTVTAGTLVCTDDTVANVNFAITAQPGPDLTLSSPSGTITGATPVTIGGPALVGAITVTNAGIIGNPGSASGILVLGNTTKAGNNVSIGNTGTINGNIQIVTSGGTGTINTKGAVTGALITSGVAAQTITVAGTAGQVDARTFFNTPTSTTTSVTDASGVTVNTQTNKSIAGGGKSTVTIAEGSEVGLINSFSFQNATIAIDGKAASATAITTGANTDSVNTQTFDKTSKLTNTTSQSTSIAAFGDASVTQGSKSEITGNVVAQGANATGALAGIVGSTVQINTTGNQNSNTSASSFDPATGTELTRQTTNSNKSIAGKASLTAADTSSIAGVIAVSGRAGATATVDGAAKNSISVFSTGTENASNSLSSNDTKGTLIGTGVSSNKRVGALASLTLGQKASVTGAVTVSGDTGADLKTGGTIVGNVGVFSNNTNTVRGTTTLGLTGQNANDFKQVSTSTKAGSSFEQSTKNDTLTETVGGVASFTNLAGEATTDLTGNPIPGALIRGNVTVNGVGGATLSNAGTIEGGAILTSTGNSIQNITQNAFSNSNTAVDGVDASKGAISKFASNNSSNSKTASIGGSASATNVAGALVTGTLNLTANKDATVSNAGRILGSVFATTNGSTSESKSGSSNESLSTPINVADLAAGNKNSNSNSNSSSNVQNATGGAINIANSAGATIGGDVVANATGGVGATVDLTNAGTIKNSVSLASNGSTSTTENLSKNSSSNAPLDGKDNKNGTLNTSAFSNSGSTISIATGSTVNFANTKGAIVGGSVNAQATKTVTINNGGKVAGLVNATASAFDTVSKSASENTTTETAINPADATKGKRSVTTFTNTNSNASKVVGGAVTVTNEATGALTGGVSATGQVGALVTNAGTIGVSVNLRSVDSSANSENVNSSSTTSEPVNPADASKGSIQTNTSSNTNSFNSTVSGGSASLTNAATGIIGAAAGPAIPVTLTANKVATVDNAGTIWGNLNVTTDATNQSNSGSNSSKGTSAPRDGKDFANGSATENANEASGATSFTTVGQNANITNAAGGTIAGTVNANSQSDITLSNGGVIFGNVNLTTQGTSFQSKNANASTSVTKAVDPTKLALLGFTEATTSSSSYSETRNATGGSINATVGGTIGLDNTVLAGVPVAAGVFPPANTVNLRAEKDATLTISGGVYANVNSNAGSSNSTYSENSTGARSVLTDKTGTNGTRSATFENANTNTTRTDGGASTVTVSGVLGALPNGSPTSINSFGTNSSVVNVSGTIDGSVSSNSSSANFTSQSKSADTFVITAGIERNDKGSSSSSNSNKTNASSSALNLSGNGQIKGSASLFNTTTANIVVGATNKIGGNVQATVGGTDSATENTNSYAYNATKTYDRVVTNKNTNTVAVSQGNASVRVDGKVGGSVEANTGAGSSTVTVNNTVGGDVRAFAETTNGNSSSTEQFVSTLATGNVVQRYVTKDSSSSTNWIGGNASVTLTAPATVAAANGNLVSGQITASGLKSASVTVGAGAIAAGGVNVNSAATSSNSSDSWVYNATGAPNTRTFLAASSESGGTASLANAGKINGNTRVNSAASTASLTNAGILGTNAGNVHRVRSLASAQSTKLTGTNLATPSADLEVTVVTNTIRGGAASAVNTGDYFGTLAIAGATGSLINNGNGQSVVMGEFIRNDVTTTTRTVGTTSAALVAGELFNQSYKADQNGLLTRTVFVGGTTAEVQNPNDPTTTQSLKTSNIAATVNLNSGSITLGGVYGEIDIKTGSSLTQTDVNLVGSGLLGYSKAATGGFVPTLTKAQEAYILSEFSTKFENLGFVAAIQGARNVVHSGAGTFYMVGNGYNDNKTATNVDDYYDIKAATVSNTGGRLVLSTIDPSKTFSIFGNVTNSAELVLGRIGNVDPLANLNSLLGNSDVSVVGQKVRIDGNLSQSTTGTMFVSLTPDLVRTLPLRVQGTAVSEVLGYANYQLSNGPFTYLKPVPGALSPTSEVTVNGNLDLQGKLAAQVQRGAIYSSGSTIGVFNVTGTVNLGATVTPLSGSGFVGFDLTSSKNGAVTTVSVTTKRTSYGSVGKNDNARSAASALDSAVASTLADIKADALGTAVFTSVERFRQVQDVANVISGFDWFLSSADVSTAVDELASGEVYASLGTLNATGSLTNALRGPSGQGVLSNDSIFQIWAAPVVQNSKYDGSETTGAGEIEVAEWAVNVGARVQATQSFSFGFGLGYREADVTGVTRNVTGNVATYLVGGDVLAEFGKLKASGQLVYGWSSNSVQRQLKSFARTTRASYDGTEVSFRAELGYMAVDGDMGVLTPFAAVAVRESNSDGFTEVDGGGIGLVVNASEQSVAQPELGLRWSVSQIKSGPLELYPYANLSYVFDGGGSDAINQSLIGGGNSFSVKGIEQGGYVDLNAGLSSRFGASGHFSIGARGQFGDQQTSTSVTARVGFEF